jgi:hypothetical protein
MNNAAYGFLVLRPRKWTAKKCGYIWCVKECTTKRATEEHITVKSFANPPKPQRIYKNQQWQGLEYTKKRTAHKQKQQKEYTKFITN